MGALFFWRAALNGVHALLASAVCWHQRFRLSNQKSFVLFALLCRPKSGSMLLYSRKKVRYRRDGYCWKKRKDGKTTREDHMKLKVQGTEVSASRAFVSAPLYSRANTSALHSYLFANSYMERACGHRGANEFAYLQYHNIINLTNLVVLRIYKWVASDSMQWFELFLK